MTFGAPFHSGVYLYTVELPKPLNVNGTANLVIETMQTHATYPWPEEAAQKDGQSLKYEAELFVLSPYKTAVQRTKFRYAMHSIGTAPQMPMIRSRSPSPQVHSYTTPESVEYTSDSVVTKSGATITYGPFHDIPASATSEFVDKQQKMINIHYPFDYPVLEVTKLERAAEISHWGANLNIQDTMVLHNAGPR